MRVYKNPLTFHSYHPWELGLETRSTAKPEIFPYTQGHEVFPMVHRPTGHIVPTHSPIIKLSHEPTQQVPFWFYFWNKETDTWFLISSDGHWAWSCFRVNTLMPSFIPSPNLLYYFCLISYSQFYETSFKLGFSSHFFFQEFK